MSKIKFAQPTVVSISDIEGMSRPAQRQVTRKATVNRLRRRAKKKSADASVRLRIRLPGDLKFRLVRVIAGSYRELGKAAPVFFGWRNTAFQFQIDTEEYERYRITCIRQGTVFVSKAY